MHLPREFVAMPDRCPGQISWHYDRAEIIADAVVHAIGVCLGLIGAVTIVVMAVKIERINLTPILVYVIGLVTMLAVMDEISKQMMLQIAEDCERLAKRAAHREPAA